MELEAPPSRPALPHPTPIELQDVSWIVLTVETLPVGEAWVFISLTPAMYERLSANMAELERWMHEARWRLDYYQEEPPSNE